MKTAKPWLLLIALLPFSGAAFAAQEFPEKENTVRLFRDQLLQDYGITALDKTDKQAPAVLQNLLFLLKHAFTPDFIRNLKNFRYLYAYAGHDQLYDLGAFHPEARAISIGGKSSYPEDTAIPDIQIITTLAHEIGHAFLLEEMTPLELQAVSGKFGGWAGIFGKDFIPGFYAKEFFSPHPEIPALERGKNNICSKIAANNIHEWFADAFAAVILQHLGKDGLLGENWRERIINSPRNSEAYWTNYNLVSTEFSDWLDQKLKIRPSQSGTSTRALAKITP